MGNKIKREQIEPITKVEIEAVFTGEITTHTHPADSTKAPLNSPSLTGTPTAPTAAAGTNTNQIATTAFVLANARPYKVYTALLSQSGTDAPTATVLENTLGGTVVWSRLSVGDYRATLTGAFVLSKTHVMLTNSVNPFFTTVGNKTKGSVDTVILLTQTTAGLNADDRLQGTPIEIRVYN